MQGINNQYDKKAWHLYGFAMVYNETQLQNYCTINCLWNWSTGSTELKRSLKSLPGTATGRNGHPCL